MRGKYDFQLERYNGIKSRHECPKCHKKRVFVRYIDTTTGRYIADDVGRCNREDKCGYHYTPKQYFTDNPDKISKADHVPTTTTPSTPKGMMSIRDVSSYCLPAVYAIKSLGAKSDFTAFLHRLFTPSQIATLVYEYCIGNTSTGDVIFWQIDGKNRVRTGKIMRYNPKTGKRAKNGFNGIDWVHSKLKRAGVIADDWELSQCLFGEHILHREPTSPVCLVESEKTAIIGRGVMPWCVWVATGGKSNLKTEKCRCLKGRDVIIYPDLGAFDLWTRQAKEIAQNVGFNVRISDLLERIATDTDQHEGLDIADYIIRQKLGV